MRATEVLIVGAGPYGLSISTHLRGRGIDHLIVGRPMDTWRAHMPAAMYLKSEPAGSDMSCPQDGYDLDGYGRSERIDGIGRGIPLALDQFLDYSDWYIKQLVPDVSDVTVTEVRSVPGGFQVAFADAEPLTARSVVIATGVLPYRHIAAELSALPSDLVSHTSDHRLFDDFRGRRVAVVGAGSSALETAALAHEAGAEVTLVVRNPNLPVWGTRAVQLNALTRLRDNKLCEGWKCPFWNSPSAFRLLPQNVRADRARTVLGPLGAWWLKDRVEGVVQMLRTTHVRGAEANGSGVRLQLEGPGQSSLDVDHVIAGTGFKVDVSRLSYLPDELQSRIDRFAGYPVLTRAAESTVPGLYFVGAPAAFSLGPSMRFIAGTHNVARQLVRSAAQRAGGQLPSVPGDEVLQASDDAASRQTA
ncbi:MAG TPA: NAD(P)-binding domain-containing protein [Streptosporangiaceae bacterium]|nr:NAD(P)-binding domain-containing protein [Streptosporangiaceae bacterium]